MFAKYYLVFGLVVLSLCANAQDDTVPENFFALYPHSGAWYAVDDSRTGLFLEIQNSRLAGVYFGFNDVGENVWLTFSGDLEPAFSLSGEVDWGLFGTPLMQAANGGCILSCDELNLLAPHTVTQVGTASISFNSRSSGRFSIGNDPGFNIVPLYFGTSAFIREFGSVQSSIPPNGLFSQPDLEGIWVVVRGSLIEDDDNNVVQAGLADSSGIIEIGPQEVIVQTPQQTLPEGVQMRTRASITRDTLQIFPEGSEIVCTYFQTDIAGPRDTFSCIVEGDNFGFRQDGSEFTANIPIENMSDSRLLFRIINNFIPIRSQPRIRVEGFRVGYD